MIDLSEAEHIERELMLIKVRAGLKEREDMKRMADIFRGRIIDVSDNTYTIELTGDRAKLDAFIKSLTRAPSSRRCVPGQAGSDAAIASFGFNVRFSGENNEGLLRQGRRSFVGKGKKVTIIGYGSRAMRTRRTCRNGREGHRRPEQGRRLLDKAKKAASRSPSWPRRSRRRHRHGAAARRAPRRRSTRTPSSPTSRRAPRSPSRTASTSTTA